MDAATVELTQPAGRGCTADRCAVLLYAKGDTLPVGCRWRLLCGSGTPSFELVVTPGADVTKPQPRQRVRSPSGQGNESP